MRDRGGHDVRQVVVDQPVQHLAAGSFTLHHTGGLEDPKMLADQRLGHPERVDQLVHAALRLEKVQHDRDSYGRGQRPQDVAGRVQHLPRGQFAGRFAVPVRQSGNGFHLTPDYMRNHACQRGRASRTIGDY